MDILVTGGAGFIGSHTCVELLQAGHQVVVVDNLANSSARALDRVKELAGHPVVFHKVDLLDAGALAGVFAAHRVDAVIHFAGLKAVGESVQKPLLYYTVNIQGTLNLLHAMKHSGVSRLVFSSSSTVYGSPDTTPITESHPLRAINPYGRTKLFIEDILRDACTADPQLRVALLRYFNPVGAHPSGRLGENPRGVPNNLMPFVMQVASGKLPRVSVFGTDYPTPDGTGVRDYIHVMDLAAGHLAAVRGLEEVRGSVAVNLGTGRGYSVLELLRASEKAVGRAIPHVLAPRRHGDAAAVFADASLAQRLWGWKATRTLEDMCADAWRWQEQNPGGLED